MTHRNIALCLLASWLASACATASEAPPADQPDAGMMPDAASPDAGTLPGSCAQQPDGTPCGDPDDSECDNPDTCLAGICVPNYEPELTACGSAATDECTAPDHCNGAGTCLPNHAPMGVLCGDNTDTECTAPDSCNGEGTCLPNDAPAGTACGDDTATECNGADTCDGGGLCGPNLTADGTDCNDCLAGPNLCESCLMGVCIDECITQDLEAINPVSNVDGIMFDMTAIRSIRITRLDIALVDNGNPHAVAVYYREGSYVGHEQDSDAWTLVGSATDLPPNQGESTTPISLIDADVVIPTGQQHGFYVVTTGSNKMKRGSSNQQGAVYVEDTNVQVHEGVSIAGEFGGVVADRQFNGLIHYETCVLP